MQLCLNNHHKECFEGVISDDIIAVKYIIQSGVNTSSFRLNPSKLNGFKTTATVSPFVDLIVSKISTVTVWSDPYPALAT